MPLFLFVFAQCLIFCLTGIPASDMKAMTLGLSHSLGRYKLKFSPDKVDTMIVQAICLSSILRDVI